MQYYNEKGCGTLIYTTIKICPRYNIKVLKRQAAETQVNCDPIFINNNSLVYAYFLKLEKPYENKIVVFLEVIGWQWVSLYTLYIFECLKYILLLYTGENR